MICRRGCAWALPCRAASCGLYGTTLVPRCVHRQHVLCPGWAICLCLQTMRAPGDPRSSLVQRWTFPFVPDTNLLPRGGQWGPSSFRLARSFIYKSATPLLSYITHCCHTSSSRWHSSSPVLSACHVTLSSR